MKTKILIVVILAIALVSCAPSQPTQEIKVTEGIPTERSFTEPAMTPELVLTETPTATPTKMPSSTPPSCVLLLTPLDGAEIEAIGRVTFSWEPMDGVSIYVLNLILPSGATVSFETTQTSRHQYMEAFSPGGDYQWNVTAIGQDRKRTEICSSELATFNKPASAPPQLPTSDGKRR